MTRDVPYCYDRPVERDDLFVGRHDTVDEIATRVRRGESFAVLGGTRIGKTSLFMQVQQAIRRRPDNAAGERVVPVFLSAQQFGRLSREAIFAAVLDDLRGEVDEAEATTLREAVDRLRRGDIAEDYAFDHFVSTLKEVMSRDDSFQLFILLDEIDELRRHEWSKTFFVNQRFLVSQSPLRRRINLLIGGTLDSADLWNTAGSPFYNVVTIVEMGLLEDEDLRGLIRVGFPDGLPPEVERRLLVEVGGHPYLMQYMLSRIWERGTDGDPVGIATRQFLREKKGDFKRWWGGCSNDARQLFAQITHSRDPFKKHAAIEIYGGDVDQVEHALDQLLINGLIRETGTNRFVAGSRLFARWALERIAPQGSTDAAVKALPSEERVSTDTGPLPRSLAELMAIWRAREANYPQLTPAFYRRIGDALVRVGEPLLGSDVFGEALERWPQPGYGFATRLARALDMGGAPRRAADLRENRRQAGYDDPQAVEDTSGIEPSHANVVVTVGASPAEPSSTGSPAVRLAQLEAGYGYVSVANVEEIAVAEALLERGGDLHLVLPCPAEEFVQAAVPGDCRERFQRLVERAAAVEEMGSRQALENRAAVDYARQVALGLATLRARSLGVELIPLVTGATTDACSSPPPAEAGAQQHRIVSLLFADTARFSQLDDVQLRRFADNYLGSIADLVERSAHAPVVKNTWGDGLYMVFPEVRDAGLFALELSDLFHTTDWESAGMPPDLRTRVGLHAGPTHSLTDPLTGQFTFMGAHVSRAARIEQITPAGSVYASRAFAALCAAQGIAEFACEYAGRITLPKGYGTFPVFHLVGE